MGTVTYMQNFLLKDSWQLEVVRETLKALISNKKKVLVYNDYKALKNHIIGMTSPRHLYNVQKRLGELSKHIYDDTKIISIDKNALDGDSHAKSVIINEENAVDENTETIILFVNPYMCLFDMEILNMKNTKESRRRIILSTKDLFEKVIAKELGIAINQPKKGFIDSIMQMF